MRSGAGLLTMAAACSAWLLCPAQSDGQGDAPASDAASADDGRATVAFEIKLETVLRHDDGEFLWFHPRVAAIPGAEGDDGAAVVMTLQKHLHVSDYYSGLSVMRTDDFGVTCRFGGKIGLSCSRKNCRISASCSLT